MSRALRSGRRFLVWAAGAVLAAVMLAFVVPALTGHPALAVSSGSMAPTLRVGDLVIEDRIAPSEARAGDVVSYRDPAGSGRLVTHRVERVDLDGGMAWFTTRGDANPSSEQWAVPEKGTIGRVRYRIPKAGYLVAWARTTAGYLLLIVVPIGALAGWTLARIWRRRPQEEPA